MNKTLKRLLFKELIFLVIWIFMWASLQYFANVYFNWTIACILIITVLLIRTLDGIYYKGITYD